RRILASPGGLAPGILICAGGLASGILVCTSRLPPRILVQGSHPVDGCRTGCQVRRENHYRFFCSGLKSNQIPVCTRNLELPVCRRIHDRGNERRPLIIISLWKIEETHSAECTLLRAAMRSPIRRKQGSRRLQEVCRCVSKGLASVALLVGN